ncbi:uncharacterized protein LOC126966700 [Leptidea sinapis]|uniref:uncharacterized protein LOC126966700 n=1 Tax=Leptidea sinapis TaxID=189913 RepID=UPI0021C29A9C|nr:uncharacterized protein LOC126966700 [Leptidea sinapis]
MKPSTQRYPLDRYLAESSEDMDMAKIIGNDLWKSEAALRPEDEILLRKLREMLQSTADDLKLLSAEFSRNQESALNILPTPMDEEFNEKIYIEEVVKAKFLGQAPMKSQNYVANNRLSEKKASTRSICPKPDSKKQNKKLSFSRTKVIDIKESTNKSSNSKESDKQPVIMGPEKINRGPKQCASVAYNELVHKCEKESGNILKKELKLQEMPSINIRCELKMQKVLQLDILPNTSDSVTSQNKRNVAVIAVSHEDPKLMVKEIIQPSEIYKPRPNDKRDSKRIISRMSTYDSSESSNNYDNNHCNYQKYNIKLTIPKDPKKIKTIRKKAGNVNFPVPKKSLDDWRKKLNDVYGQSTSKNDGKICEKVKNNNRRLAQTTSAGQQRELNNTEYIPYSKLTLGGVNVNEIEKELSNNIYKNDAPLSPVLNKITSRIPSLHVQQNHGKYKNSGDVNLLTTSDENLLQEVLDIEEKVSLTLSKSAKSNNLTAERLQEPSHRSDNSMNDLNTYADDFEIENSDDGTEHQDQQHSKINGIQTLGHQDEKTVTYKKSPQNTSSKILNLSFKNQVDTYEYIHTIDVQDIATQSNYLNKISLKETQTSPRLESSKVQTIHNDLCSTFTPKCDIEKLFALEKDFIKKVIVEEYADVIDKSYTTQERNIANTQKNTQTSPARVKNVMTSPTKTKTRATSPLSLQVTINKETSPIVMVSNDAKNVQDERDIEREDISINLSSPRFSLRLPTSSRELLQNVNDVTRPKSNLKGKLIRKPLSSSSSLDGDYSSSDISSIGEINLQYKRSLRGHVFPLISEPSSVSKYSSDECSGAQPLKSDGEISFGQRRKQKSNVSKSEGEVSQGQLK